MEAALAYRINMPLVEKLLSELGLDTSSSKSLAEAAQAKVQTKTAPPKANKGQEMNIERGG